MDRSDLVGHAIKAEKMPLPEAIVYLSLLTEWSRDEPDSLRYSAYPYRRITFGVGELRIVIRVNEGRHGVFVI
jgi:hypothetical protein